MAFIEFLSDLAFVRKGCNGETYGLAAELHAPHGTSPKTPMPQEVSVSYQAVKSKVYRLVDALVVGEKTEAEIQESIRRWWELIHSADRPIAQKYLLAVLERSSLALDAIDDGLTAAIAESAIRPLDSGKALKLVDRIVKQTVKHPNVSPAV